MTNAIATVEQNRATQQGSPDRKPDIELVREQVRRHFPTLWPAVEAGLATCATLLLADNSNPVALIYVSLASAGKTTVANMFDGAMVNGEVLCYRSDKFTPAAFVSHSARASRKQLGEIDLLPRIRHKVLLTPELSTIFRGKQDELAERFSILTRVLDGQGLATDSGTHGRRAYEGDYMFAWIGCTTPFGPTVWDVMGQLGSRLFFLLMDAVAEPTVDDLVQAINQPVPYRDGLKACQDAVHSFLDSLFTYWGGTRGVDWMAEGNPDEVLVGIARCASLLAVMRTPDDRREGKPPQHESPHRANAVIHNLARGRALVYGRDQLSGDDLPMVARVTLSSMPAKRKAVLVAMSRNSGQPLTVQQVEAAAGGSRHTAEDLMEELAWLGIMKFEKQGTGKTSLLSVRPEWAWAVSTDFAALLIEAATWQKSGDEREPGNIKSSLNPDLEEKST